MGRERRQREGRRKAVVVGLTGGIGAGKTTALIMFQELGAHTFSADEVVHDLYQQPEVADAVAAHFGEGVLGDDGCVDRSRLAAAVKGRPEELGWLEELTHPRAVEEIERRIARVPAGRVVVCEFPLLLGSGYEELFDLIVTVEADAEIRRKRSTHRFGLDQFAELEELQASPEERKRGSDMVYVNDHGFAGLRDFVAQVHRTALEILRASSPKDSS